MKIDEIKKAVNDGEKVFYSSKNYQVIKDKNDNYFIKCLSNNNFIGLTWLDGKTLNGNENDFFIEN